MYNKTIIRFGFYDIQNNQGRGRGYQPKPKAEADNPYREDITKTSSNNYLESLSNLLIFFVGASRMADFYSSEQLNYFRLCYVIVNLIPEGLRRVFKKEWDSRYKSVLGEWRDTPQNGYEFLNRESRRNRSRMARLLTIMVNGNTAEWDLTCLFYALLYSDSIGGNLNPMFLRSVEDLREIRNSFTHMVKTALTDIEFQEIVSRVSSAFIRLGLPINDIETVQYQTSFPTAEEKTLQTLVHDFTPKLEREEVAKQSVTEEHGALMGEKQSKVEPFCNLPFKPSHEILARSSEVKRIAKKMKEIEEGSLGAVSTVYLSGSPGCGKSQLARQLGQEFVRSRKDQSLTFVATLDAKTFQTLGDSYILLAQLLGISEDALTVLSNAMENTPKETINHLKALILPTVRKFSSWLIIADSVIDLTTIHAFLPQTASEEWGHGQVLITTQDSSAIPTSAPHTYHESLSVGMQPEDAVELLKQVSQISNHKQVEQVAEVLGFQPLALAAAALYMRMAVSSGSPDYSWLEYVKTTVTGKLELTEAMASSVKVAINKAMETDEVLRQTFALFLLCTSESLPTQLAVNFVANRTIQAEEMIKKHLLKSSSFLCVSEVGKDSEYLRLHSTVLQVLKTEAIFELESKDRSKCLKTALEVFQTLIAEREDLSSKDWDAYEQLRKLRSHAKSMIVSMRTSDLSSF